MTSLIRWEPIREMATMRDALDRVFDEALTRPFPGAIFGGDQSVPAMDVYQTDDALVVKMSLPGIKPEDVQITVANGVLTVRGETREETEEKEKAYHLRERRYGSFSRSVALPIQVNVEKSAAEFEDGILSLKLPKAEEAKARTIAVKTKK